MYIVTCVHPLQVVVLLCALPYSTVAVQHEELTNEDLMELEAQRKDRERQEEEVTEKPKRFTTQEMAMGFSLFEEALLVFEDRTQMQNDTRRLQQPFRMQSSATMSSMTSKKVLLPRHHQIIF